MGFLIVLLQLLLPLPPGFSGDQAGLSVVNAGTVAASVTTTWIREDGSLAETASLAVAPGSQNVSQLSRIFRQPVGSGYLRLDAGGADVRAYLTFGDEEKRDGFDAATVASKNQSVSYVRVNTGFAETAYVETVLNLINPGPTPASVTLTLYETSGAIAATTSVSVPRAGSRQLRTSEIFQPNLPTNGLGGVRFEGHLRLRADADVAVWATLDSPLMLSTERGLSEDEILPASLAVVPHFVFGGGENYASILNLVNASDLPVLLELTPYSERGQPLSSAVQVNLRPRAALSREVAALFSIPTIAIFPPPIVTGYIRVREIGFQPFRVTGGVQVSLGSVQAPHAAAFMPAETQASRSRLVPFAVNDSSTYTGLAIVNPNELLAVQTDVTVEILDSLGKAVGAPMTLSLSPAQRFAGLLPVPVSAGYLRITSNLPVMAGSVLGSWKGQTLADLPVLR